MIILMENRGEIDLHINGEANIILSELTHIVQEILYVVADGDKEKLNLETQSFTKVLKDDDIISAFIEFKNAQKEEENNEN